MVLISTWKKLYNSNTLFISLLFFLCQLNNNSNNPPFPVRIPKFWYIISWYTHTPTHIIPLLVAVQDNQTSGSRWEKTTYQKRPTLFIILTRMSLRWPLSIYLHTHTLEQHSGLIDDYLKFLEQCSNRTMGTCRANNRANRASTSNTFSISSSTNKCNSPKWTTKCSIINISVKKLTSQ